MMRRTPLQRGPWRKRKGRMIPRPGATETPRAGSKWRTLCALILQRDHGRCRRCNQPGAHIDHLLPRRLLPSAQVADVPENLACLCQRCHAFKTTVVEPQLYEGHMQPLSEFFQAIGEPWPSNAMRTHALERVKLNLETAPKPPTTRRFITTVALITREAAEPRWMLCLPRVDLPIEGWKHGDLVRVTVERL